MRNFIYDKIKTEKNMVLKRNSSYYIIEKYH